MAEAPQPGNHGNAEVSVEPTAKASSQEIAKIDGRPELFFGIVGAVGSDLSFVVQLLQASLERVRYESHVVRLSKNYKTGKRSIHHAILIATGAQ
jgi:hypothetical protein